MPTADDDLSRPRERTVTCPTCNASASWQGNAHRPFCSLTCRLVDLGVWLDEGYRVPEDEDGDVP
jgi:hypothetical protein